MSNPQVPVSSTARRIAKIIINGFRSYFADYQNVTLSAKARFEKADWHGGQQANVARMELYKTKVKQVSELLPTITNKDITDLELWRQAKLAYTQLVFNFPNFEIAETFFNSVFGDVNDHDKIDDDLIYVLSSQLKSIPEAEYSIFIRYENASSPEKLFEQLLDDVEFSLPYENKPRDITNITAEFESEVLQQTTSDFSSLKFDLLESVFYRSKAAYIVGRIIDGDRLFPFIFPVLNNEQGSLFIDTAIFNREEMSVIFSFARTHFMVDAPLRLRRAGPPGGRDGDAGRPLWRGGDECDPDGPGAGGRDRRGHRGDRRTGRPRRPGDRRHRRLHAADRA